MKQKTFITTIALIFISSFCFSQNCLEVDKSYLSDVQLQRDSTNKVFGDPETSILLKEDVDQFEGLPFYEIDDNFRICAKFKKIKKGKEFKMQTSTERLPVYIPYGTLKFKINGKKEKLTVYQNVALTKKEEYKDYLFIPFTDLTNDVETYAGGRYLDIEISDLENPIIDFNLCYNPYCAYNHKYSCPIPPLENHLKMDVKAGIKKWHD